MSKDTATSLQDLSPQGEWYGYASYIQYRNDTGDFKRHKTLGHAKSAIKFILKSKFKSTVALYEWVGTLQNGSWVEIVRYEH